MSYALREMKRMEKERRRKLREERYKARLGIVENEPEEEVIWSRD